MRTCTICHATITPADCQPRDVDPPLTPEEMESCQPGIDFCSDECFEKQREGEA